MALLLHLNGMNEERWRERLAPNLNDVPIVLHNEAFDPDDISYILAWKPAQAAFEGLNHLKAVLSIGAGVDALLAHPNLPDVPIVRFVDDNLNQCMTDFVVANVMMHQRLLGKFAANQQSGKWRQHYPAPAWDVNVGVMGLGAIGQYALKRLKPLGLNLFGWSRSQKQLVGVTCYSGPETLDNFLAQTDILVCLLPLTPDTTGILNYQTFSKLRRNGLEGGPVLINAARGGHQIEDDIVKALNDGTLSGASLDVFQTEPLPNDSPLWNAPNCVVTPHIAGISNPDSGARYFSNAINNHEAGAPLPNVVNRVLGY